jgi:serine protease AprX
MRQERADSSGKRSNALWGRGSRGEQRSNALWGRGGRRAGAVSAATIAAFVMAAAAAGQAHTSSGPGGSGNNAPSFFVASSLQSGLQTTPNATFDVIIQGDGSDRSNALANKVARWAVQANQSQSDTDNAANQILKQNIKSQFSSISGVEAKLRGDQLQRLINKGTKGGGIASIVPNDTVVMSGLGGSLLGSTSGLIGTVTNTVGGLLSNKQLWPFATKAAVDWAPNSPTPPTIAVVDSGIDANRADFGTRVLTQVNLASLTPNSAGDGYGHGTFVAGVAAGSAPGYAGVAPKAPLVSIDVMNDQGQATVADVVKACDWILANKAQYNIRVANFSLHATNPASVMFDPLDQAVEKLWLNGVVVVAAAGNYGTSPTTPSGVPFAPGNDPFVITVGAADLNNQLNPNYNSTAPWSAWGYTLDGFSKPDISAPGRYIVGPVPLVSNLKLEKPLNIVSTTYMQLSGTSFAAPEVAGAAAMILASHPTWTPDQVKGALMVAASKQGNVKNTSLGVGLLNVEKARMVKTPPNPNASLDRFVATTSVSGGSGTTTAFDPLAWQAYVKANPAWDAAAWSDAAWSDAAWSDAAWASAAWSDAAWSDVAWSDAAWSDAAWADNADDTSNPGAMLGLSDTDIASAEAAMGMTNPSCDPTVGACTTP